MLVIHGRDLTIRPASQALLDGTPGQPYTTVHFESDERQAIFELAGGALPPGLALSPDGTLQGVVDATAKVGLYTFLLHARAAPGDEGYAAYTIDIEEPQTPVPGTGSSKGCCGSSSIVDAAPSMAVLFLRRKKRSIAG